MDELLPILKKLYKDDGERIVKRLKSECKDITFPENPAPNTDWYKFLTLYAIYPDALPGIKATPLQRLPAHFKKIRELGITAVHILPFLDSPMVDRGFDVRDFMKVRKDLGTLTDLKNVMEKSQKLGLRLFMDMIFNHVSDKHIWFKKAERGDEKYRKYFIHQKTKPQFVRKYHKDSAVWAEYVVNGKKVSVNVAFPEYIGEIPHWREGKDGYWYYHTYYPEQLDVNWKNPEVFLEFAKIILYWASLGFNFRLDAIPFVGKSAYKEVDDTPNFTKGLLEAFRCLAEKVNPEAVFIVETYETEETVMEYFGTSTLRQVKLGYNFHLCTYLWVSLLLHDSMYIWEKLDTLENIPTHAEWINFLRNHDELSLAYLPGPILKKVKQKLLKYGEPFREGYGVSGRTFSFLERDEKRFMNAYLLLMSMPGGVLIPYGDEVAKENILIQKLDKREQRDTRNINRGNLSKKEIDTPKGKRVMKTFKKLLDVRVHLGEYVNIWPGKMQSPKEVFATEYKKGSSHLVMFVNLSNKKQKVSFTPIGYKSLIQIGKTVISASDITLSPYGGIWLER